jgi:hypothetical protein
VQGDLILNVFFFLFENVLNLFENTKNKINQFDIFFIRNTLKCTIKQLIIKFVSFLALASYQQATFVI